MKSTCRVAVLVAVFLVLSLAGLAAAPKIAVLDLAVSREIDQSLVVPVTETIMEALVGSRNYLVLDRAYVEQVLKEKEFQLSGLVSDSEVAKAGQFLGADIVVAGRAQLVAGSYFLVAKMIEVKTGAILVQASEQAEGKVLVLMDLARKVGARLSAGGGAPMAAISSRPSLKVGVIHDNSGFAPRGFPLPLEQARLQAAARLGEKVEFLPVYDVRREAFPGIVRELAAKGCSVVFYQSPMYDDTLQELAAALPGLRFVLINHGLGKKAPANVHMIAGAWEGIGYPLGILAGAATRSGKIGYIAIEPEPWQIYLVNEFALGVKAANPRASIELRYRGWDYDPAKGMELARSLVAAGCDTFGPLEIPQVLDWLGAEASRGRTLFAIGSEQPWRYQPKVMIAGPTRNYGILLEAFLLPLLEGRVPPPEDFLDIARDSSTLALSGEAPVNPDLAPALAARRVKMPGGGEMGAIELALLRLDEIKQGIFEPFTGPIKDNKGKTRLTAGSLPEPGGEFHWKMDWYLDNVRLK